MSASMFALEPWYPDWSRQLAAIYGGGAKQFFILHGNVNDIFRVERRGEIHYVPLSEFLATSLFGNHDAVLYYDQVKGPRALARTRERLEKINAHIERFIGSVEKLRELRQAPQVLAMLDRYLDLVLLKEGEPPSVALILDYAHLLLPQAPASGLGREMTPALATLLNWARSPYFKKAPFAFCLISERLNDLNDALTRNAYTERIDIPFPGENDRLAYIKYLSGNRAFDTLSEIPAETLARLSAGMTLSHLQGLLQKAIELNVRITLSDLKAYKKEMIEAECQGLVEFIEPAWTLDLVNGQKEAKKRLREDAELLARGQLRALPMGYLFNGPVGTGKTFLAECYAGSVGIPCVKLLNFRSKYVGETEGNLEKVLKVLRVMGPVAVVIDEADTMLGDRKGGSDSGTSSRVFGLFAAQMGNTQFRGKIIWFLLTCRPDLLPIDIKRQGRCEVHIPLFYPDTPEDLREMFLTMGRKNKVDVAPDEIPDIPEGMLLSGADIESIVMQAWRRSLVDGAPSVTRDHLQFAIDHFIPSAESDEKELQILAAVLECTDRSFLPKTYQEQAADPRWRTRLTARFDELRRALE